MRRIAIIAFLAVAVIAVSVGAYQAVRGPRLGKQADGSFMVSSGQRIVGGALSFTGRPVDLAKHPSQELFAVLAKQSVFLLDAKGKIEGSDAPLPKRAGAGHRGLTWSPDGTRLYASPAKTGTIAVYKLEDKKLVDDGVITLAPPPTKADAKATAQPGGMIITRDGKTMYCAEARSSAVLEIDLAERAIRRRLPTQLVPFEVQFTADESTLIVSNWAGRPPREGEKQAPSDNVMILVDSRGAPASGTISVIDRASGNTAHVDVGIHPTAIAVKGTKAYIACAMSDTVAVVDWATKKLEQQIPLRYKQQRLLGGMPNALALRGDTLYVADGGDNALAEVDLTTNTVRGFHPVGFYPIAVQLMGDAAYVLNAKGNGSVAKTVLGRPGNAHDFQGSVSVIDLKSDVAAATKVVAANNRWDAPLGKSDLKVYNGAIEHVIYIIKENRTYDEVFGDMPKGDGDPKLCSLGEKVMPNHRKIAREFCLFDNGYVSGTNSADGHAWSTQCLANDYLEHFYTGYSRSYPDDGEDAMAYSNGGALWDAALAKNKSIRVFGEFCDDERNRVIPAPKDWFEVWEDRKAGTKKFTFEAFTQVLGLKQHICPDYLYWPLWQSDQHRADIFIREYDKAAKAGTMPQLMMLSLPCDHGEGTNPKYPTPRAMMADNDLALGRIVEAVSNGPYWKKTCIFVVEDDAQSGPDHVDGHRTVFMAISPYTRRQHLDSTLYTQANMIRSIGMMLGLNPLNKFDACAYPMENCFSDAVDATPYKHVPNNVPLDERNPTRAAMTPGDEFFAKKTLELDWREADTADPYWLNRINWWSIYRETRPYPGRQGEMPEQGEPMGAWPTR